MLWQDVVIPIIRGLINDMGPTYTYADNRIEELVLISSILMLNDIDFNTTYTINITSSTITPDPSTDQDFVALVALKTSCLILNGEYKTAADGAVSHRDAASSLDATGVANHKKILSEKACGDYEKAKKSYIIGDGMLGRAIVSPYRVVDNTKFY